MSYDLVASNRKKGEFRMGAFSFPIVLEASSYLFPTKHDGAQWMMSGDAAAHDKRYKGKTYPPELDNAGFHVTSFEARVMARCTRNWLAINHTVENPIRTDFVEKLNALADWMETSGGFRIW